MPRQMTYAQAAKQRQRHAEIADFNKRGHRLIRTSTPERKCVIRVRAVTAQQST